MAYTVILHSTEPQKFSELATPITIGRASRNHVTIHEKSISRKHCRIFEQRGKLFLEDLKSSNGTYINGKPVLLRKIELGVPFSVGNQLLTILPGDTQEEPTTVLVQHWLEKEIPPHVGHWLDTQVEVVLPKKPSIPRIGGPRLSKSTRKPSGATAPSYKIWIGVGLLSVALLLLIYSDTFFSKKSIAPVENGSPKQNNTLSSNLFTLRNLAPDQRPVFIPEVHRGIMTGIEYILRHQNEDGSWDPHYFTQNCEKGSCNGVGEPYHQIGITGLGLLVLLAEGKDEDFRYPSYIEKGIEFLIKSQKEDGLFGSPRGKFTYNHAIATLALGEACALKANTNWRNSLKKAIIYILQLQNEDGGWRYGLSKKEKSDLSVTSWMIQALLMAKQAKISIPEKYLKKIEAFVQTRINPKTHQGVYLSIKDRGSQLSDQLDFSESMTGVAIICNSQFGKPVSPQSIQLLLQAKPEWSVGRINYYYWYQGTYALHFANPETFVVWYKILAQNCIPHQEQKGCLRGSFPPLGPWGKAGGRLYSTMICLLSLQANYRYNPDVSWSSYD